MVNTIVTLLAIVAGATPVQAERWTVREELRIGSADDSAQALTRVGDVLIGRDGLIYIAQPADQTIRVFDDAGRLVRSIGRSGSGPGEFQMLQHIGFVRDTLYATDQALRRVSFFVPASGFVRTQALASPLIGTQPPEIYSPTVPSRLLPDGTSLVWPSIAVRWLAAGKNRIPMFRLSSDAMKLDTIAQAEFEVPNVVINFQGRGIGATKPFPDGPLYSFLVDGTGVLIVRRRVAAVRSATFHVGKVDLAGDTVFLREIQYQPVPVSEVLISEAVAQIHERLARRPPSPGPNDILTALRDGNHIPRTLPPVTEASSGSDGTIWLKRERTQAPRTVWQVLSPDGTLRATVELGRNQSVKAVSGNTLIVTELDSLDVPYVVRYRILK